MSTRITLGHRPDPDEAFKYSAIALGKVDAEGLEFEIVRGDPAELAALAERGDIQVASLSVPAYAALHRRFQPLTSGATVGDGTGPIIVSNRIFIEDELGAGTTIHTPGVQTTAHLVLKLYAPACTTADATGARILARVVEGEIETGLLCDESSIVYGNFGVYKIEDLGEWWKLNHGKLPLVIDQCCVARSLDQEVRERIERVIRRSIEWALDHHDDALRHARNLGRELDDYGTRKFIACYVNPYSRQLGDQGLAGLAELLRRGAANGSLPGDVPIDPVPHIA